MVVLSLEHIKAQIALTTSTVNYPGLNHHLLLPGLLWWPLNLSASTHAFICHYTSAHNPFTLL